MDKSELLSKLNEIFNTVLDPDTPVTITETSTADDIEEWDSLAHIQLVVAIEKEFSARFTSTEVENFFNVGDIVSSLESKI